MNIRLTKQELAMLLRLASLGEWVRHAFVEDGDALNNPDIEGHRQVVLKLMQTAMAAGLSEIVEIDEVSGDVIETRAFEEECFGSLQGFIEETFWQELADRMAERDLVRRLGADAFDALDQWERVEQLVELAERYDNEWYENGLERLTIDSDMPVTGYKQLN